MDLKVVGAGSLGVRVALLWKTKFPGAKIYLKTRSDKPERSEKWRAAGFIPVSSEENVIQADYVVFSAPPTANPDYAKDVAHARAKETSMNPSHDLNALLAAAARRQVPSV